MVSRILMLVVAISLGSGSARAGVGAWPDLGTTPPGAREGTNDAAVIVAIEDYAEVDDVVGARRNAADWLRYFAQTRGMPAHRVFQALDRDGKDLRIRALADEAARAVPAGGTLWFVFIGHGAPARDGQDGVLVGVDADRTADGIYARSVPRRELGERLSRGNQAHTVLVLDACFSGQGSEGASLVAGLQPLVPTRLEASADVRLHELLATGSGEFSGALQGAARPGFSYLMLGALAGWGDGGSASPDGRVSLQEARDWVAGALNLTVHGRTQTPQLVGEDLVIGRAWRTDAPDLVAMTAPPVAPSRPLDVPVVAPTERSLPAEPALLLKRNDVRFLALNGTTELADIEVPQALWQAVTGQNPSSFFRCGDACPVENVGLDAAARFCNTLSVADGRTPVYRRGAAGWERVADADGYRLPTPDEWRQAAGTMGYAGADLPNAIAWTRVNADGETHAARGLRPTSGGWYDLSGNVSELVFDVAPGVCGGSWDEPAMLARIDACPGPALTSPSPRVGLRLARARTP